MPDKISSDMSYIVTHEYFESVSTDDTEEDVYCIVKFTSDPYNIQKDVIIYGRNVLNSLRSIQWLWPKLHYTGVKVIWRANIW